MSIQQINEILKNNTEISLNKFNDEQSLTKFIGCSYQSI